jgi:uncharacterized protein RhaS with RHS repeats
MADSQTQVNVGYDDAGNPYYYTYAFAGDGESGPSGQVIIPTSQVQQKVESGYDPESGGMYQYTTYTAPTNVVQPAVQKVVDAYTPPPAPKDYTRPKEIQESGAFTTQPGSGENVNDFSNL